MNPLASFELKGYSINEDGVEFTSVKGNHFIQPVPSEILEFSVSGYGIVREVALNTILTPIIERR